MMNKIKLPNAVVLELNYECNHHCLFCSCPWVSKESKYKISNSLTMKQWMQAIDVLIDNGINFFSISGGEPLINPNSQLKSKHNLHNIFDNFCKLLCVK